MVQNDVLKWAMAAPVPRLRLDVPEDHVQATAQLNRLLRHIEEWMRAQGQAAAGTPAGAPSPVAGGSFGVSGGGTVRMTGPKRPLPPRVVPPAPSAPFPTQAAPTIDAVRDDGMTYARPLATDLNNGHVVMTGSTGQYNIKGVGDAQTLSLDSEIADGSNFVRLSKTWASNNVALGVHAQDSATLNANVNIGNTVTTIASIAVVLPNDGVKRYILAWANILGQFNSVPSDSTVRGTISITDGTTTGGFSHQVFTNLSANPVNENAVFEPMTFLGPYTSTGQTITVTFQATGPTLIIKVSAPTSEVGALTVTSEMFVDLLAGA